MVDGKPLNSREWYTFVDKYDLQHTTSSQHYSQSNGFIERYVCTMKSALSMAKVSRVPVSQIFMKLWQTLSGPNLPNQEKSYTTDLHDPMALAIKTQFQ